MIDDKTIFYIILAISVSILLFIILREFFCWYFKINRRIEIMEKQIELLEIQKEYLLKLCQYSEYRMLKDGYIDGTNGNFVEYTIDEKLIFKKKSDSDNSGNGEDCSTHSSDK